MARVFPGFFVSLHRQGRMMLSFVLGLAGRDVVKCPGFHLSLRCYSIKFFPLSGPVALRNVAGHHFFRKTENRK